MALERQSIEKKDFPIGRRGYEPEAVDEHLARLADEIEQLKRSAQRHSGASLAQAASEQVRSIVEAAEQSAAAIERDAESEAQRIRQDAQRDAERTDQEAVERSQQHVAKVGEATGQMLQRVDAMEQELGSLLETLRTGGNRLQADLSLLESNMEELYTAAGGRPGAGAPEPQAATPPPATPPPAAAPAPPPTVERNRATTDSGPEPARAPVRSAPAPAAEVSARHSRAAPADAESAGADEDVEGARLIALNMALNGQSREETDRYLAENFDLSDRAALLDEVYESVGS